MKKTSWLRYIWVLLAASMFITSCGSSGSSSPAATATTTINGSVFAAPVSGAAVVVKDGSGNTIAGPVNTANDGTYNINIPTTALASDFRVEATGGTYNDEATGAPITAKTFAACVSGGTFTTGSVNIDPSTTLICDLVTKSGMTIGEAQTIFNNAFGYIPDFTVASKNTPSTGGNAAERLAALRAGAFSQLTKNLYNDPEKQFDLLVAIAADLGDDGKLNGSMGSVSATIIPEDMQNRFEHALVSWLSDTVHNMTGLTPDQIGSLPFGQVVLTNTYRVQYLPGIMVATPGKSTFKIKITNRSDGSAATGLTVYLMPMMHMASMGHATPVDTVAEEGSTGIYDCTAYYLMASGPGMGYWELKVVIGSGMGMGSSETATFYPAVSMGMGTDTVRTTLYGPDDIVTSMSGTQTNKYYLFRDSAVSAATPMFNLFIAHSENMMMSFKAVSVGSVLSNPTGTVTSMSVQASTDSTFSSMVAGTDIGNGHWSLSGLTGLVSGKTTTIYVKLNVNSQDKTTNGNAASGSNVYATFLVTPGM